MLSLEELELIQLLGECRNRYAALQRRDRDGEFIPGPEMQAAQLGDDTEFAAHVHVLQRQVMCRAAQRQYPEHFPHRHPYPIP